MVAPMGQRTSDPGAEMDRMAQQNPLIVNVLDGAVMLTSRTKDNPFSSGKRGYHGNGKVQGPDPEDPKRAAVFQVSLNVVRIDK